MGKQSPPQAQYNSAPWQTAPTKTPNDPNEFYGPTKAPNNPVDFYGAAAYQGQEAKAALGQQTQANRPDQVNAYGSSQQWSKDPNTGAWTGRSSFGGPLAGLASNLEGQAAGAMRSPLDFSKLPALESGSQARDQAIGAAYGQATSRLNPMWGQREQAERTRLANEGVDPNSDAFGRQMDIFNRGRNDAYTSAMNSSIGQGTQAGQAMFEQSLQGRQQALAELLRGREAPMQELLQMGGLGGQAKFTPQNGMALTPWLQAALATGNYGLGQTNQANQNASGVVSGGMDLLAALAALG